MDGYDDHKITPLRRFAPLLILADYLGETRA